jgi:murein DD-endopeptidase MepM/ murein hydrolase activator NlpD
MVTPVMRSVPSRSVRVLVVVCLLLAATAGPVAAQTDPETVLDPPAEPVIEPVEEPEPAEEPPAPEPPPAPPEGEHSTDHDDSVDEAPAVDVTVPLPIGPPPPLPEDAIAAIQRSATAALVEQSRAEAAVDAANTEVEMIEARRVEVLRTAAAHDRRFQQVLDEVAAARAVLNTHMVETYMSAGTPQGMNQVLDPDGMLDVLEEEVLHTVSVEHAISVLDRLEQQRDALAEVIDEHRTRIDRVDTELAGARSRLAVAEEALDTAKFVANSIGTDGGAPFLSGFVFPVMWPYRFTNDWGYPRSGGRSHKGTDIIAAHGTPLLAVERGVISRIGNDPLGGAKVWLVGQSGNHYYYAHVSGFAPGLHVGQVVDAGAVIAYVGDTGNAVGTIPHLHFQVHPNGGAAVNPFPLLAATRDADAALRARGIDRYQVIPLPEPPPLVPLDPRTAPA